MTIPADSPLLESLPDPLVRQLAASGSLRSFREGAHLLNEGDCGDSIYVILTGRVKVYVSDANGREMVLDFHGPGEYVGEMSLDGHPRSASVIAEEPTTCSVLSRDALRAALEADTDLALALVTKLIERARVATLNVKNLALMDVYGRVARLLLSLAQEQPDGRYRIEERLTQQDIADRVGSSRDMVSRIFRDLSIGGYISIANRQITLNRRPPPRW